MAKRNPNIKFTNPNSEEAVFETIIKLFAKANKPIIDEAIKNTADFGKREESRRV